MKKKCHYDAAWYITRTGSHGIPDVRRHPDKIINDHSFTQRCHSERTIESEESPTPSEEIIQAKNAFRMTCHECL